MQQHAGGRPAGIRGHELRLRAINNPEPTRKQCDSDPAFPLRTQKSRVGQRVSLVVPPQIRTCGTTASGSSKASFAMRRVDCSHLLPVAASLCADMSLTLRRVPEHPSCFPPALLAPGRPFPPPDPVGSVLRLPRYYELLRLPSPLRTALLCRRAALPLARPRFAPVAGGPPRAGQGNWVTVSPRTVSSGGERWASQVPGESCAYMPCWTTPAGRCAPGHCGATHAAFRRLENVGSRDAVISGLNHTACTLAVYASQRRSPGYHARLATGWWPTLAGRDCLPLNSKRNFQPASIAGCAN